MSSRKGFPDALVQEIRHTCSVHCRELVFQKRSDGANQAGQNELMFKAFHGSEAHQSVLSQFVEATGAYASAFERYAIQNNREGNDTRTEGYMLELKESFHSEQGMFGQLSTALLIMPTNITFIL